jgi:hypothetical protein
MVPLRGHVAGKDEYIMKYLGFHNWAYILYAVSGSRRDHRFVAYKYA